MYFFSRIVLSKKLFFSIEGVPKLWDPFLISLELVVILGKCSLFLGSPVQDESAQDFKKSKKQIFFLELIRLYQVLPFMVMYTIL